jgi:hypothetical protein
MAIIQRRQRPRLQEGEGDCGTELAVRHVFE